MSAVGETLAKSTSLLARVGLVPEDQRCVTLIVESGELAAYGRPGDQQLSGTLCRGRGFLWQSEEETFRT